MASPRNVLRYVKLPDELKPGKYDQYGHLVGPREEAALVLSQLPLGPWQAWGVFPEDLEPGQYGYLIFTNIGDQIIPGAPGGAFTQWDRKNNTPFFTDEGLMVLYSVSRAYGRARIIGRNDTGKRVAAAAAILFAVPPPAGPPAEGAKTGKSRKGGES